MSKKPKKPNYLKMEEVLNTYWIDRRQMNILLPQLSEKTLKIEFEKILEEMEANNEPYFNSRPILIPVDKVVEKNEPYFATKPVLIPVVKVVEKYKLNTSYILKEAKRMRRERENETKTVS